MRYSRVLAVVTLMAVVGLAAVALGRGSSAPSPSHLRRIVQQEAKQLMERSWVIQPTRKGAHAPSITVPAPQLGATTCYVATQCSITPCVIPVASAVAVATPAVSDAVPAPAVSTAPTLRKAVPAPALRNPRTGCPLGDRVPKTRPDGLPGNLPVGAPTLRAVPR